MSTERTELRVTFEELCSFGTCSRQSVKEFSSEDEFYDYLDNEYYLNEKSRYYRCDSGRGPAYTIEYRKVTETDWIGFK